MKNSLGDTVIDKIGGHGRYQILLATCLFFIGVCSDFYYFYIPLMETAPMVEYNTENGEKITEQINFDICKNYNYTIIPEKSKGTIFYDLDIFCSKWRVSLFGASLCFGSVIGTILLRYIQVIGTKNCVILNASIMIIATPIVFIKNFYVQVIGNLFFGYANINLFMLRNIIMTEITDSKYRSYFINANISTGILCSVFYFYIFTENYNYKLVYTGNAIFLFLILMILIFFTVESPRFYLLKIMKNPDDFESKQKFKNSVDYICKINKKEKVDLNEISSEQENEILINKAECVEISTNDEKQLLPKILNTNLYSSPKLKLFVFTSVFFFFVFMIIANGFEFNKYSNYMTSLYYVLNLSMILSFYIISIIMNFSITGRRYSIIICLSLVVSIKVIKLILKTDESIDIGVFALIYLFIKLFLFTCQIPIHTLITESFTTKERIANYSFMYIFAKTAALISPFVLTYVDEMTYDYLFIFLCIYVMMIVLFYFKETLNNKLSDS